MSLSVLSTADEHALDHPIWSALTAHHNALAYGNELARCYPPDVGPLAAISEVTPAGFDALTALIPEDGQVALFTVDEIAPPANLHVPLSGPLYQMIATSYPEPALVDLEPTRLGASDVPEMLQLVGLTKPGPFGPRTYELGQYLGIREDGKLVAMAGERMRFRRFVEISAVCVHPEHRGKGYAQVLMLALIRKLRQREIVPILHAFTTNVGAIALYEQLGFTIRRCLQVTVLQHAAQSSMAQPEVH